MMVKLLNYAGYDAEKEDYFVEIQRKRWYMDELRGGGKSVPREPKSLMTMAQLSNFQNVTYEAASLAEVENWVRYQMGRKETRPAWKNTGFGQKVLEGFQEVTILAKGAAEIAKLERRHLEIAMLRRYAGYLVRWYVAKGGQQ